MEKKLAKVREESLWKWTIVNVTGFGSECRRS